MSVTQPNESQRPTILVVEDEPIVRMVTVAMLEDMGFRATEAANAAAVLAKVDPGEGALEAVLLDINIPGARGRDMVDEIRTIRPNLPVLIASGADTEELRQRFIQHQQVDFLPKPYANAELRQALERLGL
ncbi:response regulator [Pseudoroseomonas ludipueritiae]|uniref:Response regulator n=1 Tax=Pseudoroseomonas ludipueritiae TaxID=198093 RepID=A0ABR7R5Y0_9PROT|nr:response regulator [Pseudoroseomonas ludipueritiae]MBC9177126.1 response regulator [Pseudoroseomonas ludipueritiae]MCG7361145.1 response regulator [Roseomonas sp. ACRSG]